MRNQLCHESNIYVIHTASLWPLRAAIILPSRPTLLWSNQCLAAFLIHMYTESSQDNLGGGGLYRPLRSGIPVHPKISKASCEDTELLLITLVSDWW